MLRELGNIAALVIGLAMVAVIVSRNAATGEVIRSAGQSFAGVLNAATGPVSGGSGVGFRRGIGSF